MTLTGQARSMAFPEAIAAELIEAGAAELDILHTQRREHFHLAAAAGYAVVILQTATTIVTLSPDNVRAAVESISRWVRRTPPREDGKRYELLAKGPSGWVHLDLTTQPSVKQICNLFEIVFSDDGANVIASDDDEGNP